jgi:hypothetical protein
MELEQLSVLDLPPVNPLGLLPRFSISAKEADAIAQFASIIDEVRLDQLPDDLAGNGKNRDHRQPNLPITIDLSAIAESQKADLDVFLENSNTSNSDFPETLEKPLTHGYLEDYKVIGRNGRIYDYLRYVYKEVSGKLKHYHIPQKQVEAIAALWHSGASSKEICTAINKGCGLQ